MPDVIEYRSFYISYWPGGSGDIGAGNWITGYDYDVTTGQYLGLVQGAAGSDVVFGGLTLLPNNQVVLFSADGTLSGDLVCGSFSMLGDGPYILLGNLSASTGYIGPLTKLTVDAGASLSVTTLTVNGGTIQIAGGETLTLSDASLGATIVGPGTLATTGTITISPGGGLLLDNDGLTWTNSGTVLDGGGIGVGLTSPPSPLPMTIINQSTGTFDISGGAFQTFTPSVYPSSIPIIFDNTGLLETTAGTSAVGFDATLDNTGTVLIGPGTLELFAGLNSTGTVLITAGTLKLDAGGTLGGTVTTDNAGTLAFAGGACTVTGTVVMDGTLAVSGGSVTFGTTPTTIANLAVSGGSVAFDATTETVTGDAVLTGGTVSIASGQTLTLSGAVTLVNAPIDGPGTLLTTGAIALEVASLDGSLVWDNSGTVTDAGPMNIGYPSDAGTITVANLAGGVFDITYDDSTNFPNNPNSQVPEGPVFNVAGSAVLTLSNAGLLEKTAGTGTVDLGAALNSTGTVLVTAGTLKLDAGGTLGGTVTTDTAGTLAFAGGTCTVTGTVVMDGTLAISGGSVTFGTTPTTIANLAVSGGSVAFDATTETVTGAAVLTGGTVSIASGQTLTLSGAVTLVNAPIDGPGTLLTTGAIALEVASLDGSLVWDNSGTVTDAGPMNIGYPSDAGTITVANLAGGVFDITYDDSTNFPNNPNSPVPEGPVFNVTGSAVLALSNAGLLEKTAGTGTVDLGAALNNTGTVDAASGTLDLTGPVSGAGTLKIEAGAALEAGAVTGGAIVFAGSDAELKIDGTAMPTATISGFAATDTIDLAGESYVSGAQATLEAGNVLQITGIGTSTLDFQLNPSQCPSGKFMCDIRTLAVDHNAPNRAPGQRQAIQLNSR